MNIFTQYLSNRKFYEHLKHGTKSAHTTAFLRKIWPETIDWFQQSMT